jgi:hypothetical protein
MKPLLDYIVKGGPAILPLCFTAFFLYHALARYYIQRWQWKHMRNQLIGNRDLIKDTLSQLDRQLKFIRVLAYILPLLGLLGTVMGMITTFQALSGYGINPSSIGSTVSSGIAEALLSTQTGLGFALPALIAQSFIGQDKRYLLACFRITMITEDESLPTC